MSIDGFTAIIMMTGEATVSIDMQNYSIKPNTIVFFNPDSIIRTIKCSSNAAAYLLAFSKSFVNEIQIDLSTSLPVYMRFGKAPVLEVTPQDVDEIRQLFQLIKTMLRSDKERYRHEIIRTLFTTAFYIITEINQREQPGEQRGDAGVEGEGAQVARRQRRGLAHHLYGGRDGDGQLREVLRDQRAQQHGLLQHQQVHRVRLLGVLQTHVLHLGV